MLKVVFALLSLADLALTWSLLAHSGGQVYEANPLARWWLIRHGWLGLAGFKTFAVVLVLAMTALISRFRPHAAGRVLLFGCVASAFVVLYSAGLHGKAFRSPQQCEAEAARQADEELIVMNRQTRATFARTEDFQRLMSQLCDKLVQGRMTFQEAVTQVMSSERAKDPAWLRALATLYPDRSPEERLACCLLRHVAALSSSSPRTACLVAHRLENQFRLAYGNSPPVFQPPCCEPKSGVAVEPSARPSS